MNLPSYVPCRVAIELFVHQFQPELFELFHWFLERRVLAPPDFQLRGLSFDHVQRHAIGVNGGDERATMLDLDAMS